MTTSLEDKEAIRELLAAYCFHTDRGNVDACVALFTKDGVFDGNALGAGRMEGHSAIRQFYAGGSAHGIKFRHLTVNQLISIAGDTATAQSYVLVLNATPTPPVPLLTGFYEDQLVKRDGRWLFKVRLVQVQ